MKWTNVGHKMYESGEWLIEHKKTWLDPHRGWYIYRGNVFVADVRTLSAAKIRVSMEIEGTRRTLALIYDQVRLEQ